MPIVAKKDEAGETYMKLVDEATAETVHPGISSAAVGKDDSGVSWGIGAGVGIVAMVVVGLIAVAFFLNKSNTDKQSSKK